jgi:hypothetical protein
MVSEISERANIKINGLISGRHYAPYNICTHSYINVLRIFSRNHTLHGSNATYSYIKRLTKTFDVPVLKTQGDENDIFHNFPVYLPAGSLLIYFFSVLSPSWQNFTICDDVKTL